MATLHVDNLETLGKLLGEAPLALVYFGAPTCSICNVVKPKLERLFVTRFSKALFLEVDRDVAPDVAAAWSVFSLPTVVVATEGREAQRFVRSFSIEAIAEAVARPYGFIYEG